MSYTTGTANNFDDLRTALVAACVAAGWTWADGILSKGSAHVRPYTSVSLTTTEGPGLLIQAGTGKSGAALTGTCNVVPRLGRASSLAVTPDVTWPATYHLHVHEAPDEIYLVLQFNVSWFYWLAFGVSNVPGLSGTGLWIAGGCRRGMGSTSAVAGSQTTPTTGRGGTATSSGYLNGFFWDSSRGTVEEYLSDAIHANVDGVGWNGVPATNIINDNFSAGSFHAIGASRTHVPRQPNAWNGESVLLPIQGYVWRASSKCSLVVDVRHARYVRLDNLEPGQIVTLGADQWKVYPFFRKNAAVRDGGTNTDHSGTMGWALRYDGS